MEEKEYYTEDELMEEMENLKEVTAELEKLVELQEKINELKKK